MTTPTLLRAADGRRMPWKNGGGETIEVAVHPAGAGLDAFDWRVSMARVVADGPFSGFAGVDRTLTILAGEGLALGIAGAEPVRLTLASAPFGFSADAPCAARLAGGPVTDLNVMTRRSRFRHMVSRHAVTDPFAVDGEGTTLVVCQQGAVDTDGLALRRHDTALWRAPGPLRFVPRGGPATLILIRLWPA